MGEDTQADGNVNEAVLKELRRLVQKGCREEELVGCSSLLAAILAEFQPPLDVTPGGGVVLLQLVLTRVADEHRRQALAEVRDYRREESGKYRSFRVAAAAELMQVPDESALYEQMLAFRREGHYKDVSWERMLDGKRGPMAERQRRAIVWTGDVNIKSASQRRDQPTWLKVFLIAMTKYVSNTAVQAELRASIARPAGSASPASSGGERTMTVTRTSAGDVTSQVRRSRRRTLRLLVAALAVIVTAAVVVVALNAGKDNPPPSGISADTALRATNLGFGSINGGLGLVYPADRNGQASEAARRLGRAQKLTFEELSSFASREVATGAYVLHGMMLEVELEGLDEREVTVHDVRVQPVERPIPLGTAFILRPSGGGDTPRIMHFNMDKPLPVARQHTGGRPFFEVERIGLPRGHKETLSLWFHTLLRASEFTVAIHYEVGGQTHVKHVDLDGQPFRIAPIACPGSPEDSGLPAKDKQRMDAMRYGVVRHLAWDGATKPTVRTESPEAFANKSCNF